MATSKKNKSKSKDGRVFTSKIIAKKTTPTARSVVKSKKPVKTMQDDLAKLITKKNVKRKVSNSKRPATREEVEMKRKLTEVYTDNTGAIPDLTKLEKTQRPIWKSALYWASAILAVLLVVSISGFFVFNKFLGDSFTNENIVFRISPPMTIVSGQESTYTITITNKEKIDLYNVNLEIFYPDDFEYVSSVPAANNDQNNIWRFSILRSGETQTIEFKGKVLAPIDSVLTFKGTMSFKPANLNAQYKQEAIVDAAVASSVVMLNINGPDKALANQAVEYAINWQNIGDADLDDLQLVAEYPSGFVFTGADVDPDEGTDNVWSIKKIIVQEDGQIKISGNYSGVDSGGNQEFKARIQIKKGNDYYPQSQEKYVTSVIKDQLSLQLVVNGSAEDQPINFDDLLVYSLTYKNTGQEDLEDIELKAILDSQILDWSTLSDDFNGHWQQNTIIWTGQQVPNLLKLGPGEEGEINWTIRTKDASAARDDNISKFDVEAYAQGEANQNGEASGRSEVKSKTIINSINSDLSLSAVARYYNDLNIPLGAGPIEPQVGVKSTYNIKVDLANNLHDVKDILLVATLPDSVIWASKANHDVGDFVYDSNSHKVTWKISRISKSVGQAAATFDVSITPTDNDLNRVLVLVSAINLTAKDADTGADINKQLKAITTSFDDPIVGKVSGVVQ